ncbi:gibberellin 2-beta-dioxygenase 2-like [Gastrolobium bilobum]|uniref:gibberellin 2-beta-dioxygenase 2-like n=1 Tax=Gastrolobium bilobum TaxID=150636 RepID=UPI002AB27582|nr:gibberellin 2-beta-dioxygenase 2-like [Gastrolobium bilobum]
MVLASPNPIRSERILPTDLPIVDLTAERSEVTKLIVKACEEYGFFKVINHGISHETIAKMEEAGFSFFAKPGTQKKMAAPVYGCKNIGFNGDMGEVEYLLLNATTPSIAQISKSISNIDPSNFSSTVSAYTEAVRELACEILVLMAEGLGVPDTMVFSRLIRDIDSDSVLRLNHYPPILNRDCKDRDKSHSYNYSKVGFGEHSDPQILTILRSNDVGGLQISLQDGVWIPVNPDPSAFCVNVGDVLEVMTNGRFVSVRHRAMTNSYKSRMSMAYFGAPPLNACIVAPPVMVTPQRPSLFRPFTWADYKKATYSLRLGDSRIDLFRNCKELE